MTQDEIIRMAREAGFEIGSVTNAIYAPTSCEMEMRRFAELVAAAEREACAQIVLSNEHMFSTYQAAESLAAEIRERSKS